MSQGAVSLLGERDGSGKTLAALCNAPVLSGPCRASPSVGQPEPRETSRCCALRARGVECNQSPEGLRVLLGSANPYRMKDVVHTGEGRDILQQPQPELWDTAWAAPKAGRDQGKREPKLAVTSKARGRKDEH